MANVQGESAQGSIEKFSERDARVSKLRYANDKMQPRWNRVFSVSLRRFERSDLCMDAVTELLDVF